MCEQFQVCCSPASGKISRIPNEEETRDLTIKWSKCRINDVAILCRTSFEFFEATAEHNLN